MKLGRVLRFDVVVALAAFVVVAGLLAGFWFEHLRYEEWRAALSATPQSPFDDPGKLRDTLDLMAQQDMAEYAYKLLLITVASTAISCLGLYALFVSLRQTSRAIKDTREIGEAQVVAYPTLLGAALYAEKWPSHPEGKSRIAIKLTVKNSGNTPAFDVMVRFDAVASTSGRHIFRESLEANLERGRIDIAPDESQSFTSTFYTHGFEDLFDTFALVDAKVMVTLQYATVFVKGIVSEYHFVSAPHHWSGTKNAWQLEVQLAKVENALAAPMTVSTNAR